MVRSHSRGRFDRSPVLDSFDSYGGNGSGIDTLRSLKKTSYTPRSGRGIELYATPPRSYGERDDHRNPISEGRFAVGAARHTMRDRMDDDDISHVSTGSSNNARDVLSKMRGGVMSAARPTRGISRSISAASPRASRSSRLLLDSLDDDDEYENNDFNAPRGVGGSKYEIIGMKEEIKKKDNIAQSLRRELDEMSLKYEDNMSSVRSKLVGQFKEDMQEMKSEWEDAFQRLKDESDATQRAMEAELNEATAAKSEMEGELEELKAEFQTQIDEEKARSKSRMEELKQSKEEDLERLRSMYEEHLDSTKKSASNVEGELKEEIHMLLEENEKIKMCYENLETEMANYKSDLDEVTSNYQKALNENLRWEKEATSYKEELDDVCHENDKHSRMNKKLEDELVDTKRELERISSQHQRIQAEKSRFEKEYNTALKDRDEASSGYNDLVKKLDDIQEERTLESRYTEALVKQRDNMNAIIENSQQELEELKIMNAELSGENKSFVALVKDASTLREELLKAEQMKERLDTLGRERERYNTTVKALKVDLKALHGGKVSVDTSLQEHMRLLNEKFESNESRLKQVDKLKSELEESVHLLEENAKESEIMTKEYNGKMDSIQLELEGTQTALVKMEREKIALTDQYGEMKLNHEDLQTNFTKLNGRFAHTEEQLNMSEVQCKSLDSENKSLQDCVVKLRSKKNDLEDSLEKAEDVKKGLKKKLESAYYDLEETQRELTSTRQSYESDLLKVSEQKNIILTQVEEIKSLKEMLEHAQGNQTQVVEEAQKEVEESYKVQMRLMEEKHEETYRRSTEYYGEKYKDEIMELREKNKTLEAAMRDQKGSLEQKSMIEIKRRGEFAKQKQELEILRSKERHLETHVNQLEEHISKVVSDYEAKLQSSSNQTICSTVDDESRVLNKRIRELEKKLEVSSAAMKQIGKSSLIMEKENERLKNDKNELKLKLRKLVDCAEKFGPK